MDEIALQPISHFKKGDAFVEKAPHPLVFMEVNEIEGGAGNKNFCIVTWYSLDEKGLNAQRRFPMVTVDGEFCNFEPISRKILKEAKSLMRQYDAEVKQLTDKKKAKSLYKEYNHKLIELLPDAEERLALVQQVEKEIVTNKWIDCDDDNYWVEVDSEQSEKYATIVCVSIDSYDDKKDKTIVRTKHPILEIRVLDADCTRKQLEHALRMAYEWVKHQNHVRNVGYDEAKDKNVD